MEYTPFHKWGIDQHLCLYWKLLALKTLQDHDYPTSDVPDPVINNSYERIKHVFTFVQSMLMSLLKNHSKIISFTYSIQRDKEMMSFSNNYLISEKPVLTFLAVQRRSIIYHFWMYFNVVY